MWEYSRDWAMRARGCGNVVGIGPMGGTCLLEVWEGEVGAGCGRGPLVRDVHATPQTRQPRLRIFQELGLKGF